jgi:hypothetical protein
MNEVCTICIHSLALNKGLNELSNCDLGDSMDPQGQKCISDGPAGYSVTLMSHVGLAGGKVARDSWSSAWGLCHS